jgi:hypothetical protein
MIGHGEIKTEQADDRPDQTFGLAQWRRNTARKVSAVVIARAE